jgi:hypothetical protein
MSEWTEEENMPLTRTQRGQVISTIAGRRVIKNGEQVVMLSGDDLETHKEIERLTAQGKSKEADVLLLELGRKIFGPDFNPQAQ